MIRKFLSICFFLNEIVSQEIFKSISYCCNGKDIFGCFNSSRLSPKKESMPKLTIMSYAGGTDIMSYYSHGVALNAVYSALRGYNYVALDDATSNYEKSDKRWNKVKILINAFKGWAKDVDYLMWVDADIIFLNLNFKIEEILRWNPEAHIIASAEHSQSDSVMNSGSIIFKNTEWTRKFLTAWWGRPHDRRNSADQDRLTEQYLVEIKKKKNKTKFLILSADEINSNPPAWINQKPHNSMVHLMGESNAYRERVFAEAFKSMCATFTTTLSSAESNTVIAPMSSLDSLIVPPQWNVTQVNLLQWAIEVYQTESNALLATFKKKAKAGRADLQETKQLHASILRFAQATDFNVINIPNHADQMYSAKLTIEGQMDGDKDEAVRAITMSESMMKTAQMRKKNFDYQLQNLEAQRIHNDRMSTEYNIHLSEVAPHWPELLKLAAEAGQYVLDMSSTAGGIGDVKHSSIAEKVLALLEELRSICADSFKPQVEARIAEAMASVGKRSLERGDHVHAINQLTAATDMFSSLAETSGNYVLLDTTSLLAAAYRESGDLKRSTDLYALAQRISEQKLSLGFVPETGSQLLQFMLQRAELYATMGDWIAARKLLQETNKKMLEYIDDPKSQVAIQNAVESVAHRIRSGEAAEKGFVDRG